MTRAELPRDWGESGHRLSGDTAVKIFFRWGERGTIPRKLERIKISGVCFGRRAEISFGDLHNCDVQWI